MTRKRVDTDLLYEQAWEIAQRTGEVAFVIGTPRTETDAVSWRDRRYGTTIYKAIWPDGWRYRDARRH